MPPKASNTPFKSPNLSPYARNPAAADSRNDHFRPVNNNTCRVNTDFADFVPADRMPPLGKLGRKEEERKEARRSVQTEKKGTGPLKTAFLKAKKTKKTKKTWVEKAIGRSVRK